MPKLVDDSRFEARRQEADDVIQLNKWALEWWEQQLEQGGARRESRATILAQREITDETRKTFRLGFAPDSWEALSSHLRQKGASQMQIDRSGLVVKKEEGGSYDRFRGRLIVSGDGHSGAADSLWWPHSEERRCEVHQLAGNRGLRQRAKSVWFESHARRDPPAGLCDSGRGVSRSDRALISLAFAMLSPVSELRLHLTK